MTENNVLSANKLTSKLHTAVSVAFSYLRQCRVKTGWKIALILSFSADSAEGGGDKGLTNRKLG